MMLVGGFGFLMTFLKRFGFSALGMTLMIVAIVTEWSILLWGFTKMENFTIHLNMMELINLGIKKNFNNSYSYLGFLRLA